MTSTCLSFSHHNKPRGQLVHRRFVASIIVFRPAALSLRFLRTGADVLSDPAPPALFAAHLFLCAAAILARATADIRRRFVVGADELAPFLSEPPLNICRSSAICALIRFFCSSKPSMAAVISSQLSFAGIELTIILNCGRLNDAAVNQKFRRNRRYSPLLNVVHGSKPRSV
jgi:hypothetical protein